MPELRIGTSAFTAAGWSGQFYPKRLSQRDYLSYYATKFDTVEVDSTFYGTPTENTVKEWNAKTPPEFLFAVKVPQIITHDKVLVDCDAEFKEFIRVIANLGDKLGPILFQFGYFNSSVFRSVNDFLARLKPFLKKLPDGYRFAVEIRNKHWLAPQFIDTLRERGVALALIDQSFVAMRAEQWFEEFDPITADFSYVRLLGDRKGIEERTKIWNSTVIDRTMELTEWAGVLGRIIPRIQVYTYVNNHYAGYAPDTVEEFKAIWNRINSRDRIRIRQVERVKAEQGRLFE
jgi:uncharacterized protein YecE (DUF72 family)